MVKIWATPSFLGQLQKLTPFKRLTGMAATAFFTHDYIQQALFHISEAITTD